MSEPTFSVNTGMSTFLAGDDLASWLAAVRDGTESVWIGNRNRLATYNPALDTHVSLTAENNEQKQHPKK